MEVLPPVTAIAAPPTEGVEVIPIKAYRTEVHNDWCPGCGDFGILTALQSALQQLQIPPHRAVMAGGIGCSGKTPHYVGTYGIHTLHGRVLPVATGIKLVRPELTVVAMGGDGDGYGIGGGYWLNAGRRNVDITYLVFDNGVYGLTKGQGSPTLARGTRTKSMPEPANQDAINPLAIALGAGYTFVARGYALDVRALTKLLVRAIQHRGTSFIDILQTCPTYNDLHTKDYFGSHVYDLEAEGYSGAVNDPSDAEEIVLKKAQAFARSYERDRLPLGVFYQVSLPSMQDSMPEHPLTTPGERDLSEMVASWQ
jgi:2-oxoglutarate ferredoxin oxidoreductase subunit beta